LAKYLFRGAEGAEKFIRFINARKKLKQNFVLAKRVLHKFQEMGW
jgi:hypothetical protein